MTQPLQLIDNLHIYNEYKYELDEFQKKSIDIIELGQPYNILITAHTGSGKSLVAEHAIKKDNSNNKRTIYTSPIKTLSNQKYFEFKKKYVNIEFGLITGDHKCNPLANCIIMTTEILLDLLTKTNMTAEDEYIKMDEIGTVIFDEVHYIDDKERGGVWERCIMKLPSTINQVLLSATISHPEQFAKWIERCNGNKTYIFTNNIRPVPLYFSVYYGLTDNIVERKKITKSNAILTALLEKKITNKLIPIMNTNENKITIMQYNEIEKIDNELYKLKYFTNQNGLLTKIIMHLYENNMLPSIFFILSKEKIQYHIQYCEFILNTIDEQITVEMLFDNYLSKLSNPKENYYKLHMITEAKQYAIRGYAIHHSGLIPVLKEIIELLYSHGLIKVLFATETFSVGLNMPTKTVLFTSIMKHDGVVFRTLHSHEFIQMSGRAGRRGIDTIGNVIYLPQFEKELKNGNELKALLSGRPKNIISKYNIDPIVVLKMLLKIKQDSLTYSFDILINEINGTLWKMQLGAELEELKKKRNNIVTIINNNIINNPYTEQINCYSNELEQYNEIEESKKTSRIIMKNNDKIQENIRKKISNFEKIYKYWKEQYLLSTDLQEIDDNIEYITNIAENSIANCLEFLFEQLFIDINNELTPLGICATQLSPECMQLLISKMMFNSHFQSLSGYEMTMFIARNCIYNGKVPMDHTALTPRNRNVTNISLNIDFTIMDEIYNILLISINKYKLYISNEVNDNFIPIVSDWLEQMTYSELSSKYSLQDGLFIRAINQLRKIITSVYTTFIQMGQISIADKLKHIDGLLFRDIINIESLYIFL